MQQLHVISKQFSTSSLITVAIAYDSFWSAVFLYGPQITFGDNCSNLDQFV